MNREIVLRMAKAMGAHLASVLERAVRREVGRAVGYVRGRLGREPAQASSAPLPAPARARPSEAQTGEAREAAEAGPGLLDLNRATEEELMALPGIGPARAQAIVAGRPYGAEEDLVERKIVPERVFDEIETLVCVDAASAAAAASRPGKAGGSPGEGVRPEPRTLSTEAERERRRQRHASILE